MYKNKLVCCILVDGKILREFKDEVYIPYGSEYSVMIKNLNFVRASVKIEIDGKPVFENNQALVVAANSKTVVERFVSNNNAGNRFKFVQRTDAVEKHMGVGAEDGLLRVSFQFEKPLPRISSALRAHVTTDADVTYTGATDRSFTKNPKMILCSAQSDVGVTVAGSISTQKFETVASFPLEDQTDVLVLHLLGDIGQNLVTNAITVKTRLVCETCGTSATTSSKFCSECGTCLEFVA